jgi:hypothetical protein
VAPKPDGEPANRVALWRHDANGASERAHRGVTSTPPACRAPVRWRRVTPLAPAAPLASPLPARQQFCCSGSRYVDVEQYAAGYLGNLGEARHAPELSAQLEP